MVGAKVRELLESRNMSQYRLAKISGVSPSYICELINGKYQNPSMNILKDLSRALGVSMSKLTKET